MVFPSVPIYLDPPNWPQQSGGGMCDQNNHHQLLPPPAACTESPGGGTSSVRSVITMTDRARIAKIPQPETALKCPRCESTNTKFCYFNNYSLTQPRHLCKTCRRYWTRGGSLRNVPVGGGCRRNKRSSSGTKSSSTRSKSPATTTTAGPENNNINYNSTLPPPASTAGGDVMMASHFPPHQPSFMNQYGISCFGGIQVRGNNGSSTSHDDDDHNINNDVEFQWRLQQQQQQQQQFHFMMNNNNNNGTMEATPATGSMYTAFELSEGDAGMESYGNDNNSKQALDTSILSSSVKVEGNNGNNILNLSRNFLGISNGGGDHQNQYWVGGGGGGGGGGGNAWTDQLARFTNSSSSTRNLL